MTYVVIDNGQVKAVNGAPSKGQTVLGEYENKKMAFDTVEALKRNPQASAQIESMKQKYAAEHPDNKYVKAQQKAEQKANAETEKTVADIKQLQEAEAKANEGMFERTKGQQVDEAAKENLGINTKESKVTAPSNIAKAAQATESDLKKLEGREEARRAEAGTLGTGGTTKEQKEAALNSTNGAKLDEERKAAFEEKIKESGDAVTEAKPEQVREAQPEANAQLNSEASEASSETNALLEGAKTAAQVTPTDEAIAKANPEAVEEEIKDDPEKRNKLFADFKAGKLDMYPVLKTIVEAISRDARMTLDRAALLTGGQRDPEAYDTIETEIDRIRGLQESTRAKTGMSLPEAFSAAEKGDYSGLSRMIASGEISYEDAYKGLSGASKEAFADYYNTDKQRNEVSLEQQKANLKQTYTAAKQQLRTEVSNLEQQKREIDILINSLAGDDYDAYIKAAESLQSVRRGIETSTTNYQAAQTDSSSGNVGGGVQAKVFNIGAGGNWTDTGTTSSGSARSKDELLAANLPTVEEYAKQQQGEKNRANELLKQQLESEKARIDELIAAIKSDYKEYTGKDLGTGLNYKPKESAE